MVRLLKCLLVILASSCAWAGDQGWTFILVTSGPGRYNVVQGKATVTIKGGKLHAALKGEDDNEFEVVGQILKNKVKAKFTQDGSDYFIGSPFSGAHTATRWCGTKGSSGRESISLSDGWNYIGLSHEFP